MVKFFLPLDHEVKVTLSTIVRIHHLRLLASTIIDTALSPNFPNLRVGHSYHNYKDYDKLDKQAPEEQIKAYDYY